MERQETLVMPGDKIGVEEEFIASENTFVDDDGTIRAAIPGTVAVSEGKISVINKGHNIIKFKRGMFVVGTITDDLKSVMFVKLDRLEVNGKEYIAIKDGKIVSSSRPQGGGGRDFGRRPPRGEEGERRPPAPTNEKPAKVGDVILAKILYEDPEIFTLTLNDAESGVVYAECSLCGTEMKVDGKALACPNCGNKENRKISPLYSKPEDIKRLFV